MVRDLAAEAIAETVRRQVEQAESELVVDEIKSCPVLYGVDLEQVKKLAAVSIVIGKLMESSKLN